MLAQSLDETVVWTFGPMLRTDGTAATDLTDDDVFTWTLWAGDDQAPAATGSGTLRTEIDGKYVDATITTAAISTLAPGIYDLRVYKNPGVDDVVVFSDSIRLTFAPGSATPLPVYCSFNDLTDRQSWIETLQDVATTQAGFAEQRHRARQWLDSQIIARVQERLETQYSRHGAVACVEPIVPTTGVDLGPTWGPSILPDTTIQAQIAVIQGYLDADKLMAGTIDNGDVANITAWYTLYLIAQPQAAGASGDKDWAGWAATCKRNAIRACASWTAKIDTDDDGTADYEVSP